ncbi:MAG: bifunctional hydroxymethylpyrimidine kinase/phosphomethylpyrimidine kinase [Bacteroidales bacterium]|nr:bifunctional hydroxymethylpyrimidine kinase/phosphomethylpyrimidine kinase [Bacteroidales bacterium]
MFDGNEVFHFETIRIDTKNTHGTGCTFSSAVASQLARGVSLWEAVQKTKDYVTMAIGHSLDVGKGYGSTHHFWHLYQYGLQEETDGGK